MIVVLLGVVASRRGGQKLSGTIHTNSTDPNHIGSVIRAIAGEVELSSSNRDGFTVDNVSTFLQNTGDFFEIDIFCNALNEAFLQKSGNNDFMRFTSTTNIRFPDNGQTNLPTPSITLGAWNLVRVTKTAIGYQASVGGVSGADTAQNAGTPFIGWDNVGNKIGGTPNFDDKIRSFNLNGFVFDFNESGNDPKIYTT